MDGSFYRSPSLPPEDEDSPGLPPVFARDTTGERVLGAAADVVAAAAEIKLRVDGSPPSPFPSSGEGYTSDGEETKRRSRRRSSTEYSHISDWGAGAENVYDVCDTVPSSKPVQPVLLSETGPRGSTEDRGRRSRPRGSSDYYFFDILGLKLAHEYHVHDIRTEATRKWGYARMCLRTWEVWCSDPAPGDIVAHIVTWVLLSVISLFCTLAILQTVDDL